MLMEVLKDYILLTTGAMIGILFISLCTVAGRGDRWLDKE